MRIAEQRLLLLLDRHYSHKQLGSKPEPIHNGDFSAIAYLAHYNIPLSLKAIKLMIWNQMHVCSGMSPSYVSDFDQMKVKVPIWKVLVRIAWKSQAKESEWMRE